jgi:hypothetical protein
MRSASTSLSPGGGCAGHVDGDGADHWRDPRPCGPPEGSELELRAFTLSGARQDREPSGRLSRRPVAQISPLYRDRRHYQPHEPPASLLGAAIRYLTNHQIALARFLEAGEVPPDNGIVERLHVRAALTRKNFLFAGSDAGGDRAAIAYTILSCCRLASVKAVDYLADVLPRLARRVRIRDVPAMLPSRWRTTA